MMISDVSRDICVEPDQLPVVVSKEAVEPLALPVVALMRSQVGCTPVATWPANDDMILQVGVDPNLLSGRVMNSVDPDVESGHQVLLKVVSDVDWDACHTKWRETVVDDMVMEKFVLVPEVFPVGYMMSAAEPTFLPALSEVYSVVVLAGGGGVVAVANPLVVVESGTARVSVLPVVGSELPAFCVGKDALDLVGLRVGPSCLRMDVILDGRFMKGAPVLEPLEHSVLKMTLDGGPMEGIPVLELLEHSVLEVARNGRPMVGISVLEPLEHSVPDALVWGDCSLVKMTVSDPLEHLSARLNWTFPGRVFRRARVARKNWTI